MTSKAYRKLEEKISEKESPKKRILRYWYEQKALDKISNEYAYAYM